MAFAALLMATPAAAQTPAARGASTPDPARLAAAERLLTVLLPPARFKTMIDGMTAAMEQNLLQSFRGNPALGGMFDDPRVRPIFERYMTRLTTDSTATMRAAQPAMMVVMTRAYARRFTVAQLGELDAFFRTPTGQAYMDQGTTIMSDPDVADWQQQMMRQQFDRLPQAIAALTAELQALPPRQGH